MAGNAAVQDHPLTATIEGQAQVRASSTPDNQGRPQEEKSWRHQRRREAAGGVPHESMQAPPASDAAHTRPPAA